MKIYPNIHQIQRSEDLLTESCNFFPIKNLSFSSLIFEGVSYIKKNLFVIFYLWAAIFLKEGYLVDGDHAILKYQQSWKCVISKEFLEIRRAISLNEAFVLFC